MVKMTKEEFIKLVSNFSVNINSDILDKLEIYKDFLKEYNTHTNLTAIKKDEDIYLKHFYDSLTLCSVVDLNGINTLLDIGSGAGFPGMVLKIFYPHLHVTLLDSNNKKTKFLELLKEKLKLNDVEVINDRVENITKERLNHYELVTARAVTNLTILTELAMPLVKPNYYFVPLKGSNYEEIEEAKFAINKMHGEIGLIKNIDLPLEAGLRNIIKITKNNLTNIREIRSYNNIIKKPLKKILK